MPRPDIGTRQKLIDTATELVWTASYGSVSVDDICRAAKVNKGSFYHYFPSKQDLALAAMEEHFEKEVAPDMSRVFAANVPFEDQIAGLADMIIEKERMRQIEHGRVCGCPFGALASEMIGQGDDAIAAKAKEVFNRCKSYMRRAIEDAMADNVIATRDIDDLTSEVHDFFTGQMMMARIHNSLDGLERDLKPGLIRILYSEHDKHKTHKTSGTL